MGIEDKIKEKALSLGFDIVGITSAENIDNHQLSEYKQWLAEGSNGGMEFLARDPEKRFSPSNLLPEAKSIVCAAVNYKVGVNQIARDCRGRPFRFTQGLPRNDIPAGGDSLKIASYALYPDYHTFLRKKLSELADFIKTFDKNFEFKICVDSAPVAEKALAMRAGIGFIGRNRLVTNATFGSFLLLGEIITNLELKPDEPIQKQCCGDCRKCIEACPTGALTENGFDACKCISYLTIEYKGEIEIELSKKMGNHLFGCDECLLACPYNHKSPVCKKEQHGFSASEINFNADDVISWTEKDFQNFVQNSAMQRTGLDRIKRNAIACKSVTR